MRTYLGLGSNLGDRHANLARALKLLEQRALRVERVSPVVESPALLPDGAPPEWNRPFLNLAVACESEACPRRRCVKWSKEIELRMGRKPGPRWAPRPMDIDILLWGDRQWLDESLTIPHPGLRERNFVLTPMVALEPRLVPPGANGEHLLECSRRLADPIPLWMGIVNVTPDSFSDGGRFTVWPHDRTPRPGYDRVRRAHHRCRRRIHPSRGAAAGAGRRVGAGRSGAGAATGIAGRQRPRPVYRHRHLPP